MIVRAVLVNPLLADNFDFFNDYSDTLRWLESLPKDDLRDQAIERLERAYKERYLKPRGQ